MIDKYKIAVMIAMLALCFSTMFAGNLSKIHQVSDGEIAAAQLTIYGEIYWRSVTGSLDAPIMAVYDEGHILTIIYGSRDTAESAKESIINYMTALEHDFMPYLKEHFGIQLSINDFIIVYRNRKVKDLKKILIWGKGEYKIPS